MGLGLGTRAWATAHQASQIINTKIAWQLLGAHAFDLNSLVEVRAAQVSCPMMSPPEKLRQLFQPAIPNNPDPMGKSKVSKVSKIDISHTYLYCVKSRHFTQYPFCVTTRHCVCLPIWFDDVNAHAIAGDGARSFVPLDGTKAHNPTDRH